MHLATSPIQRSNRLIHHNTHILKLFCLTVFLLRLFSFAFSEFCFSGPISKKNVKPRPKNERRCKYSCIYLRHTWRTFSDLCIPDDTERVEEMVVEVAGGGAETLEYEYIYRRVSLKRGKTAPIKCSTNVGGRGGRG